MFFWNDELNLLLVLIWIPFPKTNSISIRCWYILNGITPKTNRNLIKMILKYSTNSRASFQYMYIFHCIGIMVVFMSISSLLYLLDLCIFSKCIYCHFPFRNITIFCFGIYAISICLMWAYHRFLLLYLHLLNAYFHSVCQFGIAIDPHENGKPASHRCNFQ